MYILLISLLCSHQQLVLKPGLPLACCVTSDRYHSVSARVHKGRVDSSPRPDHSLDSGSLLS